MKYLVLSLALLIVSFAYANDGAYYVNGNHLIPIQETDISVRKEILTLKKIRNQMLEVTVYYEFYNPKEDKKLTVGFEAFSPSGDAKKMPVNGAHPYMRNFTVEVNNSILPHQVAYVNDSMYAKSGSIKSRKLEDVKKEAASDDGDAVDFFYVYHFTAPFKKGLNIIKHTYSYDLSVTTEVDYYFEYVLTAANRWANKQIDDFTLVVDMEEFQTFAINKNFFNDANEWLLNGIGKTENIQGEQDSFFEADALKFHIQKGNIIFQKRNFHPRGELFLVSKNYYRIEDFSYLPFSYYQDHFIPEPKNDFEKKVLKNLPFARRGYVFQNPELKAWFEKMDWYIPNPNYTPDHNFLTEVEKRWIERWK